MRAVDQERGLGLHLAPGERRHLEIADQVTGARGWILGPGHAGVEAGHPHLEVPLVLLEDRQVAERGQLAVGLPARDVLAAGAGRKGAVAEERQGRLAAPRVSESRLAEVERRRLAPQPRA